MRSYFGKFRRRPLDMCLPARRWVSATARAPPISTRPAAAPDKITCNSALYCQLPAGQCSAPDAAGTCAQGAGFLHAGVATGVRLQRQDLSERMRSPQSQGRDRHDRRLQEAAGGRRRSGAEARGEKEEAGQRYEGQLEIEHVKVELRRLPGLRVIAGDARSRHRQRQRPTVAARFQTSVVSKSFTLITNISLPVPTKRARRPGVETAWLSTRG